MWKCEQMNIVRTSIFVSCFIIVALSSGWSQGIHERKPATLFFTFRDEPIAPNDSTALSLDSLMNAFVNSSEGWVRLNDGVYSIDTMDSDGGRISFWVGFYGGFINVDLDGDGDRDAIVCLSENSGGSGIFNSLDIFLNRHGSAFHTASYLIGDREVFDSLYVTGNTLDVFFKVHSPSDGACCPTLTEKRRLKLVKGEIVEVE